MKTSKIFRLLACRLALVLGLASLASCGMMDDNNDYCATTRRVRFVFDRNMLFADAFASQVKTVTLYAYSLEDSTLQYRRTARVADMHRDTAGVMYIDVNDLPSGHYRLLVWAEGENRYDHSFAFGPDVVGSSHFGDLTARLQRDEDTQTVAHDVTPLFHGMVSDANLTDLGDRGTRVETVRLTKDTNVFRIVLQNLSGDSLGVGDFDFKITDDNGLMAANNDVVAEGRRLTYTPWSLTSAKAGIGNDGGQVVTGTSAVVAELTTARLIPGHDMRLIITRTDDGQQVANVPLIDYCLLVKGNYNRYMTDLEYLDREDHYDLTFFIDSHRDWMSASILINQWRVVLQNTDM